MPNSIIEVSPPKYLRPIFDGFLANKREELKALNHLLDAEDFVAISQLAHRWKGVVRTYGLEIIEPHAKHMEQLAKDKNKEELRLCLNIISAYLANIRLKAE